MGLKLPYTRKLANMETRNKKNIKWHDYFCRREINLAESQRQPGETFWVAGHGHLCPKKGCLWTWTVVFSKIDNQCNNFSKSLGQVIELTILLQQSLTTWSNSLKSQSDSKCGLGNLSLQNNVLKKTVKTNFEVKKDNSMVSSVFCYDSLITAQTKTPSPLRPSTFAPQSTTWSKRHELSIFFYPNNTNPSRVKSIQKPPTRFSTDPVDPLNSWG